MMAAASTLFDAIFDRVNDSSGRTRSALYVFMVVNFALFLTVYGADLYRRPVERLDDFIDAIVCAKNKLDDSSLPTKKSQLNCRTAKEDAAFAGYDPDELAKVQIGNEDGKSRSLLDVLSSKRMEALVSEEVATKRVQIPIVGFTFDIDYLWLLTSFFGPLGMIVVVSCLRSELEEIRFAREYLAGTDLKVRSFRARLLLSTQVLLRRSAPGSGDIKAKLAGIAGFTQRYFVYSIFLLPLLTQAIMVYYDGFFVDIQDTGWTYFWDELNAEWSRHALMQAVWLTTTAGSTVVMILSVIEFFATAGSLHEEYEKVEGIWKPGSP